MFDHNIRLSRVILIASWLAARVAAAPAKHAAGIKFTPVLTNSDHMANLPQAAPIEDAHLIMQDLHNSYLSSTSKTLGTGTGTCTEENIIVRKEWGDLTPDERRSYIAACKCLHDAPPQTPNDIAPGARNRWDDFVVAHLLNTDDVHRSPWLLPFHSEWLWQLEKALRDECGLEIGLPYWDHSRYLGQPLEQWPMFDGSDTSLSGNGRPGTPNQGCSCITEGPFADWTVNLSPVAGNHACTPNPRDDGLGFNERCLERNWKPEYLENLTYANAVHAIRDMPDPNAFNLFIETWPLAWHNVPHVMIGGTQDDVPGAPGDPIFPVHHAGVDRGWRTWMALDMDVRTTQLPTAEAYNKMRQDSNSPPAPAIFLNSEIRLSSIFETVKVGDVMSATGPRYCYRYD